MRVYFPNGILHLSSLILRTVMGPLDLYLPDFSIPEQLDLATQNGNRLYWKIPFRFHLDHNPFNHMISAIYIYNKITPITWSTFQSITGLVSGIYFFNKDTSNTLCTLMQAGRANSKEIGPILAKTSKGSEYLEASLEQFPKFKELFLGLNFKNT